MRALLVLLLASQASAQSLTYTLVARDGPSPRFDGTIAYDEPGRQIFLFGGADGGSRNDLWAYSLAERRWREIVVEGSKPDARFGHTLSFDAARRRLILFGGQDSGFFSDVWAYDIASQRWQQLARNQTGPSNRYGHSAIYDAPRDRLIISHGFTGAGRFDDTWAFDLRTNTWRNVSPASGRPLRRCLHHAEFDGANTMLLYGGCASGAGPCPLGDLWSFDLTAHRWTEVRVAGASPAARQHYGLAYDVQRRRLVLFGGSGGGALDDTWEFDGTRWQPAVLSGTPPESRSRHQGTFAPGRNVSFFFGGSTNGGLTNELWMLGPAFVAGPVIRSIRNSFSGDSAAISPGEIVSLFGSGLGPPDGVAFGFDTSGRLPVNGPGVTLTFDGVAAPLLYASETQVNAQVPYELAGGAASNVQLTVNGVSFALTVPLHEAHPGLFPQAFHPDGRAVTPEAPALPGAVVILFATGHGPTTPPSRTGVAASGVHAPPVGPLRLTVAGRPVEPLFVGQAPGTVGVLQLNLRLPEDLGDAPRVTLAVGDAVPSSLALPLAHGVRGRIETTPPRREDRLRIEPHTTQPAPERSRHHSPARADADEPGTAAGDPMPAVSGGDFGRRPR